ncbi:uncharacterized protein LOC106167055 [Lingula anatina]|uniref:Uncharacterized protein LOC106167055 n=1 Tax=Lingula anatina TaxID=7574 RepID=A0A1S3ISZ0_LINAN|nr:uncharacterized protein LOC106167055 [Lingula anatina]|eukprot:XP_013401193.1 uncharacterized protein LOC106167055 [Lingula anatina]
MREMEGCINVETYLCSVGVQQFTCIGGTFEVDFNKRPPQNKELEKRLPQEVVIQICSLATSQRQDVFKHGQFISVQCPEKSLTLDDTVIYSWEPSFSEQPSLQCCVEDSLLRMDYNETEDNNIYILYSDSSVPCGESWQDITAEARFRGNRAAGIFKYRAQKTGVYCIVQATASIALSRILQTMNQISSNVVDKYVTVTITRKPGPENKAIVDCLQVTDPRLKNSLYRDSFNQLFIAMAATCSLCLNVQAHAGNDTCTLINPKLDAGGDNRQPLCLGEHATEDKLVWIHIFQDDYMKKSIAKLLLKKREIWNYQHLKMPSLKYKYKGIRVRTQSSSEFNTHAAKRHLSHQVQDSLQLEQSFSKDYKRQAGSLEYASFEEFNKKRVNRASKDRLNIFLKLIERLHSKKKK